jgi:hypothetical protein
MTRLRTILKKNSDLIQQCAAKSPDASYIGCDGEVNPAEVAVAEIEATTYTIQATNGDVTLTYGHDVNSGFDERTCTPVGMFGCGEDGRW